MEEKRLEEQLKFHSRKGLEKRIFVDHTRKRVLLWKSEADKFNIHKKPYVIMTFEEFRECFNISRYE